MMKICNKKTGEVVERTSIVTLREQRTSCSSSLVEAEEFSSIEQLNEYWEDYKPKEPLINDEKVRKAVRAWADTNQSKFITSTGNYTATDNNGLMIEFNKRWTTYMENGKRYTITELCGEEEQ